MTYFNKVLNIAFLFIFTYSLSAQDSLYTYEGEIVVTASRIPLSFPEISRNVAIITKEEIEQAPVNSVQELLSYVSGVDVQQRGAIEAADAMLKAAKVELIKWHKVGSALVIITIKGELGACQSAVDAGKIAAAKVGELVSYNIIANPYPDTKSILQPDLKTTKNTIKKTVSKQNSKKSSSEPKKQVNFKENSSTSLLQLVMKAKDGITLQEASDKLSLPAAELRIIFKELMDTEKIVKVRRRYYPIKKRGTK